MAGTSYQMYEVLKFYNLSGEGLTFFKITVLTFLVKKSKMKFAGLSFFLEHAQKLQV